MSTSDPDRPADDTTTPATTTDAPPSAPTADERRAAEERETVTPAAKTPVADTDSGTTEPATVDAPTTAAPTVATPAAPARSTSANEAPTVASPAAPAAPAGSTSATEAPTVVTPATAAPTVATPSPDAPVAAKTEPVGAKTEPVVAKTEPVSMDTGRHAVVRPAPVPPDDVAPEAAPARVATTQTTATPAVEPSVAAVTAASVANAPATQPAPITPEPEDDGRLFPDPNAPSSPTLGSRILGVLVGLVLAPIAVGVLLLGESQILEAQTDGWDATTSVFGIVLVTLGLLLLGCVLLLGVWTAAVPITGGALLTAVGSVYLYVPSLAREQTLTILTSKGWQPTIVQVTVAATSGMVIAVGFLLLLAGLVIASARRRGIHLGEFRERHKA